MSCPWGGNIRGAGITGGCNPPTRGLCPMAKGTLAKMQGSKPSRPIAGWEGAPRGNTGLLILGAQRGWGGQIDPNAHGRPQSRAIRSMRRCLLILMVFMPFAKLNAAWHEVPFFCPCFVQTGGVQCLLLTGICKKNPNVIFLRLLNIPGRSKVRNSPDCSSIQIKRLFSNFAGSLQDSS